MTAVKETQGCRREELRFPAGAAPSEASLSPAELQRAVGALVEGESQGTRGSSPQPPQTLGQGFARVSARSSN